MFILFELDAARAPVGVGFGDPVDRVGKGAGEGGFRFHVSGFTYKSDRHKRHLIKNNQNIELIRE